jgi:hypothetical protein
MPHVDDIYLQLNWRRVDTRYSLIPFLPNPDSEEWLNITRCPVSPILICNHSNSAAH